jgi:hypothetical protein
MNVGCSLVGKHSEPPIELIVGNVESTDVTVVLEVTAVTKVREEGLYSTWKIGAIVMRSFKGRLTVGEKIEYLRTMETDFAAPQIGSRHIVSFVWEGARLVIPDVGYHFEYSPSLERRLDAALRSP